MFFFNLPLLGSVSRRWRLMARCSLFFAAVVAATVKCPPLLLFFKTALLFPPFRFSATCGAALFSASKLPFPYPFLNASWVQSAPLSYRLLIRF
jgi:hypothetical protein